jgi:SAM-dependent methyltransferase
MPPQKTVDVKTTDSQLAVLEQEAFHQAQRQVFSSFATKHFFPRKRAIRILEAGCGKKWNFDLNGMDCVLTGLDISKDALDARRMKQQDLDETIVGDLRTVKLADARYDVIYCAYVLEHIDGAEHVLDKFFKWLRPGGLLVLIIPDGSTQFGFLTKITPFWFHVLFYKYILGSRRAGEPGHAPFRTFYDRIVSRQGVRSYVRRHGHRIHLECGCKPDFNRIFGAASPIIVPLSKIIETASFGRLAASHSAMLFVIEKTSCV